MAKIINERDFKKKLTLAVKEKADLRKLSTGSLRDIAEGLIKQIKKNIRAGISPITGRRFAAYKNPKKYPGKKKPQRPVNLFLTGDFLKSLIAKVKTGKNPTITITFNDQESFDKEAGHRDGAKGQPKRPIIPEGDEKFTEGILAVGRQIFRKVIDRDLK